MLEVQKHSCLSPSNPNLVRDYCLRGQFGRQQNGRLHRPTRSFLFVIVSIIGLFLGQFVILFLRLREHVEGFRNFTSCLVSPPHTSAFFSWRRSVTPNPCEPP